MNKLLTGNFNFIKGFNQLAAEVYKDKKYYYLSNKDIAKYRKLSEPQVKNLVSDYKSILKDKDSAWLSGLSNRAKAALVKNKYTEYSELYKDVMNEKIDLECFDGVGHKVALEIRRWCVNHA